MAQDLQACRANLFANRLEVRPMPAVTPSVPSQSAAPLPPPARESDRPELAREPRTKSVAERAAIVTLEPHWTATIDAATD